MFRKHKNIIFLKIPAVLLIIIVVLLLSLSGEDKKTKDKPESIPDKILNFLTADSFDIGMVLKFLDKGLLSADSKKARDALKYCIKKKRTADVKKLKKKGVRINKNKIGKTSLKKEPS